MSLELVTPSRYMLEARFTKMIHFNLSTMTRAGFGSHELLLPPAHLRQTGLYLITVLKISLGDAYEWC